MSNGFQYEYMNEASIDSELICIICNKTLEDPQCTPCDHIFCKSCITEWIQRNNMSCPTCRRLLRIHELIQASRTVRNILGKIHVKCMTCGKIDLERSDFEQHVAIACPAACLAADIMCPWTGTRGQLDNHLTNCSYQNLRPILVSLMAERQQLKEQVSQRTAAWNQSKEETMQLKNVIEQHKIRTENSRRHFKEREMQDKTQMDQYLNKCRKFEEQLKREQNQNDQRHNEIDHLKDQKKELLAQMDKCKKEFQVLTEQLKRERTQNDANQSHIRSLKEKLKQKTAAAEDYRNDTMQLNDQLKKQRAKTSEYVTEVKMINEQMKDQHRTETQQLREKEMHYKADIAEYQKEIKQLKQQMEHEQIRLNEIHEENQDESNHMKRTVQVQNEQPMGEMDSDSGRISSVWSRLSDRNTLFKPNQKTRRHTRKRLAHRHCQYK
ncbi:unnamed protein product [Rotaria magnacalcarata]|uniref:RING-type domain-containing protein n=2 Tax=Rotaria magnacalcarata TaxID=392030 RepID=A0A816S9I7_9BILA|nr:unnamed protein product [Rotaria magnacalcarata]